ncbi:MAG: sigma-70 family RNA polymerase sigma factor [Armatimonadetes bacterium]|nr:sigma-70 family RNA polymerase sigma factor [Armatimonadota bacterium]
MAPPDLALVDRCRRNDTAAFDEVVGRYKNKVYNYIYRMVGNTDDAEDLTQEVFVRMYTSLESFRRQASLHTWLFRIASNLCIDHFRRGKKARGAAYSLDEPPPGDGGEGSGGHEVADAKYEPHRLLEQQEMAEQIQQALGRLPEKLRTVLILHDIEDLPYEEIAQVVGCPLGTVKSRLFHARLQLRERLAGYIQD